MTDKSDIVAVALLKREDVSRLSSSLRMVFKADHSSLFEDLLEALDRSEQEAPDTPASSGDATSSKEPAGGEQQ